MLSLEAWRSTRPIIRPTYGVDSVKVEEREVAVGAMPIACESASGVVTAG
jgi:hypothetical protein